MFVALTRSRRDLILSYTDEPSPFLAELPQDLLHRVESTTIPRAARRPQDAPVATDAQNRYIRVLAQKRGVTVPEGLTRAAASDWIAEAKSALGLA